MLEHSNALLGQGLSTTSLGREYETRKVTDAELGERIEEGWRVLFRYPDGSYQLRRLKLPAPKALVIPVG